MNVSALKEAFKLKLGKITKSDIMEFCPSHEAELKAIYEPLGKEPYEHKWTTKSWHYFAETMKEGTKEVMVKVTDRFGKIMTQTLSLE